MKVISDGYSYSFNRIHDLIITLRGNRVFLNRDEEAVLNEMLKQLLVSFNNSSSHPTEIKSSYFYHCVDFGNDLKIHLHFNITKALQIQASFHTGDYREFPRKFFVSSLHENPEGLFFFNSPPIADFQDFDYAHFDRPVLLIRYPISQTIPYLVIDGNHRIAARKDMGKPIKVQIIDLIDNPEIVFTKFDYAFYLHALWLQERMLVRFPELKSRLLM